MLRCHLNESGRGFPGSLSGHPKRNCLHRHGSMRRLVHQANSSLSVTDEKRAGLLTSLSSVSAREHDPRRGEPQGSDNRRAKACGVGLQRKETDPAHRRNSTNHLVKGERRIDEALERPHRAHWHRLGLRGVVHLQLVIIKAIRILLIHLR